MRSSKIKKYFSFSINRHLSIIRQYYNIITKKEGMKRMEKIKILMIDDNTNLVEMVKEYFTGHNKIEVTLTCKDGEEGLDAILNKSSEYDIILLIK